MGVIMAEIVKGSDITMLAVVSARACALQKGVRRPGSITSPAVTPSSRDRSSSWIVMTSRPSRPARVGWRRRGRLGFYDALKRNGMGIGQLGAFCFWLT